MMVIVIATEKKKMAAGKKGAAKAVHEGKNSTPLLNFVVMPIICKVHVIQCIVE